MSTRHSEPIGTTSIQARDMTGTEKQRRRRHDRAQGIPATGDARVWVVTRNNLPPFRPYVYRGTGYDQITGER